MAASGRETMKWRRKHRRRKWRKRAKAASKARKKMSKGVANVSISGNVAAKALKMANGGSVYSMLIESG
jgi:hypothetical protein